MAFFQKSRKRNKVLAAITTAALTAAGVSVFATQPENGSAESAKTDAYLVIDLEKLVEESLEESTLEEASTEAEATPAEIELETYLDLSGLEDTGSYTVNGDFAPEPIVAQLLAQKEDFSDFDAAGIYEVFGKAEDLESYSLNLVLPSDATLYHYSVSDGSLEKRTTVARFEEDQEKKISISSESNHWMVVYLRAEEAEAAGAETTGTSSAEESALEESVEATTASETTQEATTKPASVKAPETTKTPETKPASTTAPSTTAPTTATPTTAIPTTAHTHAWVPVTNTVHHDVTYKDVWVEDAAAWDETVLVSDAWDEPIMAEVDICNVYGYQYPIGATPSDYSHHALEDPGDGGGWYTTSMQVGTTHHDAVYNTVHHDAVYNTVHHEATGHYEKVQDQAAWDETVTTGYKCSSCGATK